MRKKILKFSIIVFIILIFIFSNPMYLNTTYTRDKKDKLQHELQIAVDKYKNNTKLYPTTEQPEIGIPKEIDFTLLNEYYVREDISSPIYKYYVDDKGLVYVLPKELQLINIISSKQIDNTLSIYWNEIPNADKYIIKEVKEKNKNISQFSIDINLLKGSVHVSNESILLEQSAEKFVGHGSGRVGVIIEYEPNTTYLISAEIEKESTPYIKINN